MRSQRFGTLIAMVSVGLLACGGDGGGSVSLPIDSTKKASELTASERQQLCEAGLDAARNAVGSSVCAMMGLIASMSGDVSCAEAQQSCLKESFSTTVCAEVDPAPSTCDMTIAEIEQCMNEALPLLQRAMPTLSCSSSLEQLQNMDTSAFENFEPPASCARLDTDCQGVSLGVNGLDFENMMAFDTP